MKKFVILGGGYGGLTVAKELLEKQLPADTVITMIDRMPYQGLKTEYYALASGTVSDVDLRVSYPVDPRLIMKYGEVTRIALDEKLIYLNQDEPIAYDWLVISLGCTDNFHGITGAEEHSCSIQTFSSTRHTYQMLNDVKPYGQVTIVGGGLSGVEVAAELRESRTDLNIRVLDRGPSILSAFPGKLQEFVRTWFNEHDVEMQSYVSLCRLEQGVLYNKDELIYTDSTVWTAGIQPVSVVQQLDVLKDAQGRVLINENHQIPTHKEVFVVGDCASLPYSPSAQAAEGQGKQVVEVITDLWNGKTPKLGKIKLKGVLGSLGKKSGFGLMGKRPMMGRVPRLIKSGVLWMSKRHSG